MAKQDAKAIIREIALNYAENGEEQYCDALEVAMKALEAQIKLKECIANLDNPEFEHLTWSHEEVLKLLKEHIA